LHRGDDAEHPQRGTGSSWELGRAAYPTRSSPRVEPAPPNRRDHQRRRGKRRHPRSLGAGRAGHLQGEFYSFNTAQAGPFPVDGTGIWNGVYQSRMLGVTGRASDRIRDARNSARSVLRIITRRGHSGWYLRAKEIVVASADDRS
jgi:hypothetical protein